MYKRQNAFFPHLQYSKNATFETVLQPCPIFFGILNSLFFECYVVHTVLKVRGWKRCPPGSLFCCTMASIVLVVIKLLHFKYSSCHWKLIIYIGLFRNTHFFKRQFIHSFIKFIKLIQLSPSLFFLT